MKRLARLSVGVTVHAVQRLRKRFPQFKVLSNHKCTRLLFLAAYLGRKLKRMSHKSNNDVIFIRANNLFDSNEDIVMMLRKNSRYSKFEYSLITVLTYKMYLELRRASRAGRPLRKEEI